MINPKRQRPQGFQERPPNSFKLDWPRGIVIVDDDHGRRLTAGGGYSAAEPKRMAIRVPDIHFPLTPCLIGWLTILGQSSCTTSCIESIDIIDIDVNGRQPLSITRKGR